MSDIAGSTTAQEDFFRLAVELDDYGVDTYIAGLEYNGFDPNITFNEMISRAKKLKREAKVLLRDITLILTFYVVRGTNFKREDLRTRTKSAKDLLVILQLIKEYGLEKNPKLPTDVTIGRLAAAFPQVVCLILLKYNKKRFGGSDSVPPQFLFPQAPCLWSEAERKKYYPGWINWMFEMQKRINKKGRRSDTDTQQEVIANRTEFEERQLPIYEAMISSEYTNANRHLWRSQIGLQTEARRRRRAPATPTQDDDDVQSEEE